MAHKFNPKNKKKLNSPMRRELLPPKQTLEKLFLKKDDIVADIGCGIGYFTFPASEIVGQGGRVYAIDISDEMLVDVREKLEKENINNIEVIKGDVKTLEDKSVTYAFVSTVLHEIDNKNDFLSDIKKGLKSEGRVVIIEWEKKEGEFGPPIHHRISKEDVKELLIDSGFNNVKIIELNSEFYALTGVNG